MKGLPSTPSTPKPPVAKKAPGAPKTRTRGGIKYSEADLQQRIRKYFEYQKDWSVLSTSTFRQKGPSGCQKGVPDLLAFSPKLPGIYVGLEVKLPGKVVWSSPEQRELVESGVHFLVQSEEDCMKAITEILRRYKTPTEQWMTHKNDPKQLELPGGIGDSGGSAS